MDKSVSELITEISEILGIEARYWDISGVENIATDKTKLRLIDELVDELVEGDGYSIKLSAELLTDSLLKEKLAKIAAHLHQKRLSCWIPPVWTSFQGERGDSSEGDSLTLTLPADSVPAEIRWSLQLESGAVLNGGENLSTERIRNSPSNSYFFYQPQIAVPEEIGYHQLSVEYIGVNNKLLGQCQVVVAPATCYRLPESARYWGLSLQISALTSNKIGIGPCSEGPEVLNIGTGDLGNLFACIAKIADLGVDVLGLNPLHALFERNSAEVSPYSPSSRLARNVLLIALERIPFWSQFVADLELSAKEQISSTLSKLNSLELQDYAKIYPLKLEILEKLFAGFISTSNSPGQSSAYKDFTPLAFRSWKAAAGNGINDAALFFAVREFLMSSDASMWGWPVWPAEYRNPHSSGSLKILTERSTRVEFYLWLQWVVDSQLAELQRACLESGMKVGLYLDMALGANSGGAETWSNQEAYCFGVGMGAPPDELGPQGQAWGLPPYHPHRLRTLAYQPFRAAVRASMQHAGALRIDHMMSLFRLFWIPNQMEAKDGAYVRYGFEDLLAILAIESQRAKCVIIGEDLGTVPDEVRSGMSRRGILSYKVLYFMQDGYRALRPGEYQRDSLVVTSTHDLATLRAFWSGEDIYLRQQLGLFDSEEIVRKAETQRALAKNMIFDALREEGLWGYEHQLPEQMNSDLSLAIHRYLARANSQLQIIQVEDLLQLAAQVNVPGTTNEHPNWIRRLPQTLEEILALPLTHSISKAMRDAGRGD